MNTYIVFESNEFGDSSRGANDIVKSFNNVDDAIIFASRSRDVEEYDDISCYTWSHIYDVNNRKIVWDKNKNNAVKNNDSQNGLSFIHNKISQTIGLNNTEPCAIQAIKDSPRNNYIVFAADSWGNAHGGAEDIVDVFDYIDEAIEVANNEFEPFHKWCHIYDIHKKEIIWNCGETEETKKVKQKVNQTIANQKCSTYLENKKRKMSLKTLSG